MEKWIYIFSIVFLLSNAVQYCSCERFNIIPTADSPCPGEFTGEPCLTLQQYVANPSLSSNITLELHSGNHRLDSQLSVANINSFTMRANATVTVTCADQPEYLDWMRFNQMSSLHVSGITFIGCKMSLSGVTNAKVVRNSFVNKTVCCNTISTLNLQSSSSVLIKQCTFSNNRLYGGALKTHGVNNLVIDESTFVNNYSPRTSFGKGAIHIRYGINTTILNSNFTDNHAVGNDNGGALYVDGGDITIINTTFVNNTALGGGGGALYSARRYTNIYLTNNTFSYNTAAYCGVMDIDDFFHYHVNLTGNTFTYNRAVGQVAGNNGGGVICIRNASISLMDNNFSHNTATGDAGVIRVDESHVTIQRSIFNNNTAGGDGGVFHTYFYPTTFTIVYTSFTDNQAGGDGGVMYVGRAGSYVTIVYSTFTSNSATNRGGALAVIGTTVHINGATISDNTAQLGEVVSACNSNVTFSAPQISPTQDPVYSFCSLYDSSGIVHQTPQPPATIGDTMTTSTTTTDGVTMTTTIVEDTTTTVPPATTSGQGSEAATTTTLSPPDEATSNQPKTMTTTQPTTATTTNEQTTTPTFTTSEDSSIDTTTAVMEETTSSEITNENITTSKDTMATTVSEITATTATPVSTETATSSGRSTDGVINTTVTSPEATTAQDEITKSDTSVAKTTPPSKSSTTRSSDYEKEGSIQLTMYHVLPGYIALGVSALLLFLFMVFGTAIIVVVYRARPKPQRSELTNFNINENGHSTIENEYTISDVQVDDMKKI